MPISDEDWRYLGCDMPHCVNYAICLLDDTPLCANCADLIIDRWSAISWLPKMAAMLPDLSDK